MNTLYAHGKLLLSAEYMVMHGSKALALPLQLGQSLEKIPSQTRNSFSWTAYDPENTWFSARFDPSSLRILHTTGQFMAERLQETLRACIELMPVFQRELFRWDVVTRLEFSREYGFGSSSTLIALLAEWADVNPLELHFMVSGGSGYDVACALAEGPILYHLRDQFPSYRHVSFHPPFSHQLFFAWLGKKQPTASHLESVSEKIHPSFETIHHFTRLTMEMVEATSLVQFRKVMEEHEEVLSRLLGIEKVSRRFDGLPGSMKSLGAWGGDFVMIASEADEKELKKILKKNDIHVVYRYKDLIYEGKNLQQDS
jgi:mevalonate kinase